ncbi:MAG: tetratricopeptide repeat protein, partial [Anaerolineales bacterium]|nr:tetratricopeptide repeat protein [Anaerolineales bacterium]
MSEPQNFHTANDQYIEIKGDFVAGDLIIIQTIVLPDPPPPLWVDVPAAPTHKIIGRETLRNQLFALLTDENPAPLTLNGLSGVGKTTLALLAAYHPALQAAFPDGVLWGSCGPLPNIPGILNRWGEALGRPISHLPTLAEKAAAVKQLIGTRKVLLILDDVWELEDAQALLCGGPHCAHLITTPEQTIGRKLTDNENALHLESLTTAESVAILSQLAPAAYKDYTEAVQQIAAACGGLPLAVVLIGGYLEEQGDDGSGLFADLTAEALAHVADPAARLQLINEQMDNSLSLQDTLALSLDIVSTEARQAFFNLGVFAPRPDTFSRAAAEEVAQTSGRTLLELTRHNLLEVSEQQLALHPLLADFAKTKSEPAAVTRHWGHYLAEVQKDPEDWRHIETLYGQIRWAWQTAAPEQQYLYLDTLHLYQMRRGLWEDQAAWAQQVIDNGEKHHTPDHQSLGLNMLGQVYDFLGQPDKALGYMQQTLTLAEAQNDEAQKATALTNIGRCYDQLNQPEEALSYYNQALPLVQATGNRLNEAKLLNNIGLVYDYLQQPA